MRVYVAGGRSPLGAALRRRVTESGWTDAVGANPEPDLMRADEVDRFFTRLAPDYVVLAAGPTGGIRANQARPADIMRDNLLITCHVLGAAHRMRVKKLMYLGSSCTYPREAAQPMGVDALMTGPLEPISEAYALAKLAGMTMCRAYRAQHRMPFISVIPADMYGPGNQETDSGHVDDSHLVAALLRRAHEAKHSGAGALDVWGSGTPRRELIYVDDVADACCFLLDRYDAPEPINVGSGEVLSVHDLAKVIAQVVGFRGSLKFDPTRPDGAPAKALDSAPIRALGWQPRIGLREGLERTYLGVYGSP